VLPSSTLFAADSLPLNLALLVFCILVHRLASTIKISFSFQLLILFQKLLLKYSLRHQKVLKLFMKNAWLIMFLNTLLFLAKYNHWLLKENWLISFELLKLCTRLQLNWALNHHLQKCLRAAINISTSFQQQITFHKLLLKYSSRHRKVLKLFMKNTWLFCGKI
jgi:hypothetical protein